MELVSVIVPVYNVENYLDNCINSILHQTYRNIEVILVDDGSTDNSPIICDEWLKKDSRIYVVHKKNGGLSEARNVGINYAHGEYISFIDSDDFIECTFLQQLYNAIRKNSADISECGVKYVDEKGNVLRYRPLLQQEEMSRIEALKHLVLEDGVYQTVWNKLYKKDILTGISFQTGKCNEDDFWTYQVFDRANKIVEVNQFLYNYLQRSNSIIGVGYNIRRLDGLQARFERMKFLQKYKQLNELVQQQFVLDCMWHYQSALQIQDREEAEKAIHVITSLLSETEKVRFNRLTLNFKYKVWYEIFMYNPRATARIRNMLRIGI